MLRSVASTLLPMVALIVLISPGAWAQDGQTKGGTSAEAAGCPIGAGRESRARRRDLVSLCVFGVSFLVINAVLIVQAAS
jgi:hypothetical protein